MLLPVLAIAPAHGRHEPDHRRRRARGDRPRPGGRTDERRGVGRRARPAASSSSAAACRRRRRDLARHRAGRGARAGRRVGLGQDDRRAWRCSATCGAAAGSRRGTVHGRRARPGAARAQRELRRLRGGTVAYIPQDPGTALNPALRHRRRSSPRCSTPTTGDWSADERDARIREALEEVALPTDDAFLAPLPAPALGRPAAARGDRDGVRLPAARSIVCDEPTTGLDVTTQARVLETVRELLPQPRRRRAVRQPRPGGRRRARRPGRGDVRRADRRVGHARPRSSRPRATRTRGGCCAPSPTSRASARVVGIPGHAPLPGGRPEGCAFHPALHAGRATAAASTFPPPQRRRRRPDRPLPPRGRGRERDRGRGRYGGRVDAARRSTRAARSAGSTRGTARAPTLFEHRPRAAPARVPGARRRVRLGQDDARPLHRRAARGLHGRRRPRRRRARAGGPPAAVGRAQARSSTSSRTRTRSLNPRRTVGQTIARQLELFDPRPQATRSAASARCLERVALSRRRAEPLPRPALRRRAPARRDRPRARGRADGAGLRRDHLRARRVGAGGDHRAARASCAARSASACSSSPTTWR